MVRMRAIDGQAHNLQTATLGAEADAATAQAAADDAQTDADTAQTTADDATTDAATAQTAADDAQTDATDAQTRAGDLEDVTDAIDVTVGAEVAGPPDHIPLTIQAVEEPGGANVAKKVTFRIRIYDDQERTTPSTVGNHRLTQTGAGVGTIISGDDSIDMVVETDVNGQFDADLEDVAGASGVDQFFLIEDAGNDDRVFASVEDSATFN